MIRARAGAERRAANTWSPWSPMLADGEARRCFLFGTWRSAVAELFGNSRSQQLAAGQPSDVLALCWILASAERDRSLNLLGKGAAFHVGGAFPRAREGGTPRPAVSIGGSGAQLWGLFGASRSKALAEDGCGVCALWHFRLGDRALDSWACGRRTARGHFWSPVLADSEARRCFLFGTWRSAVGSSSATAGRRAAFGCARTLLDLEFGRARPLLESARKGGRVNCLMVVSSRARGQRLGHGFDRRRRRGAIGSAAARPDRNRGRGWLWRVCALAFQAGRSGS